MAKSELTTDGIYKQIAEIAGISKLQAEKALDGLFLLLRDAQKEGYLLQAKGLGVIVIKTEEEIKNEAKKGA